MAALRVTRQRSFGVELRPGAFEIVLDGKTHGRDRARRDRRATRSPNPQDPVGALLSHDWSVDVVDGEDAVDREVARFPLPRAMVWPGRGGMV